MSSPWVFIDISYLAHRARFALSGMEYEDFPTGIIYGFFEQLKFICQNPHINSNKVCLFFDSKKSYRRKLYPEYKKKRKDSRTEEEKKQIELMYFQVRLLWKQILPDIGISTYRQTGLESDDIMAQAAMQVSLDNAAGEGRRAIIITSDGDLYQCITQYVHWYDPGRDVYLTPRSFLRKKRIRASKWGEVKAIAGCSSDEVAGVPGVGEKSAIQFLLDELPKNYKRYQSIISPAGQAIIERNRQLVLLPHAKTKIVFLKPPAYDTDAFFHYCEKYGLLSFLKERKRRAWMRFFHDKIRGIRRKSGDNQRGKE